MYGSLEETWNGPFLHTVYIYINIYNVVNRAKTLIERTELLVLLKQIKLEQKNDSVTNIKITI